MFNHTDHSQSRDHVVDQFGEQPGTVGPKTAGREAIVVERFLKQFEQVWFLWRPSWARAFFT